MFKKLSLCILMLLLVSCVHQTSDLSEWKGYNHGYTYTLYDDSGSLLATIRIFLDGDSNDTITRLFIATNEDVNLMKLRYPDKDETTLIKDLEKQCAMDAQYQKDNIKIIPSYRSYWEDKKNAFPSVFSGNHEDETGCKFQHNDVQGYSEILNFTFWNKDTKIKGEPIETILKRYHLMDAYDETCGYLSYKKLKEADDFTYSYIISMGKKDKINDLGL